MKISGDAPEQHKALVIELEKAERIVQDGDLPPERKAQIYTCLAYDWFDISLEEEGTRLLLKAEKACPGYYNAIVKQHMDQDPTYDYLVKGIAIHLVKLIPGLKA